jgi:hypothetical protein
MTDQVLGAKRLRRLTIVGGAKRAGYLQGLPLSSDRYVGISLHVTVW